ncbi:thioredoxin family protein [Glaciecola siphonariae]|uniref:Thioredoxin family protein n=1 Tax=Glaciecola siphonariae TaxID=521012 RepID=A0ABV9LW51_9ALTE
MNKFITKALGILLVFTIAYFGNRALQSYLGAQAKQDVGFEILSLEDGLKQAKKDNKLILANYSAIWCPSCRKLDKQVFADERVYSTIASNFIFVLVDHDSDEGKDFAKKFDIAGFPRVLLLNQGGEKLSELPLSFDPDQYKANLQNVLMAFPPS